MNRLKDAIFFAILAVCGMTTAVFADNRIDAQRPDAPALAAYGEFNIGVRTLNFVHKNQIDILAIDPKAEAPKDLPHYDRPLTVEFWYPAEKNAQGSRELKTYLRGGKIEVTLIGKGVRDAAPPANAGPFPLVIISHGYPGNRFLLSHLAENIASKGYVVAAIDHTDSTYRTRAAFGSTLVNRSLDQTFVLEEISQLSNNAQSFLHSLVDADNAAVIGYSMGGYGAVITAGGGLTQKTIDSPLGGLHGTLRIHGSNSATHNALPDPRIKTAIVFGPWGMNQGVWNNDTLKGVQIPMFFIAGSVDDVSGYENGTRAIWKNTTGVDRALLTYDNANHNAGAPIPAPKEAYKFDEKLGFNISEHYSDAVWDNVRMNNIAQHFVTAWLGKYLKSNKTMQSYFPLVPYSNDGVWAVDENGNQKPEHTYWKGFPNRTAKGLHFETLKAGE